MSELSPIQEQNQRLRSGLAEVARLGGPGAEYALRILRENPPAEPEWSATAELYTATTLDGENFEGDGA